MNKIFKSNYKVTIGDLNYGGHMGNDKALIVFQQARIDFLRAIGYDETNVEGNGLIQLESHVYYLKEVLLNENLLCKITDIVFDRITFDIIYEISNEKDEIVLKGSTKMAIFNYQKKKISRIPKEFIEKISNL